MLTLTDLATLPLSGFCEGGGGDLPNWRISICQHETLTSTNLNSNSIWKFCQKIVRRWFYLSFINGPSSLWCTKVLPAVVFWGLTSQGRRLGFIALGVSYENETTTHATDARNRMLFCHAYQWINCCHFNWQLQISSTKFFRRWFDLSFISGSFSQRLLCDQKFQLTFLNKFVVASFDFYAMNFFTIAPLEYSTLFEVSWLLYEWGAFV